MPPASPAEQQREQAQTRRPLSFQTSSAVGVQADSCLATNKVVISDGLTPEQTEPWRDTTRIIRRADAHQQIAELKRQPGKDILVFGSRTLWNDLLAHDLVDELHLMIGPVVLGAGTPVLEGQRAVSLRLIDTRTWDGSDNVLVRYEVQHRSD
jgi:dihydrofolate reductase